jgi:hypothetical protein
VPEDDVPYLTKRVFSYADRVKDWAKKGLVRECHGAKEWVDAGDDWHERRMARIYPKTDPIRYVPPPYDQLVKRKVDFWEQVDQVVKATAAGIEAAAKEKLMQLHKEGLISDDWYERLVAIRKENNLPEDATIDWTQVVYGDTEEGVPNLLKAPPKEKEDFWLKVDPVTRAWLIRSRM